MKILSPTLSVREIRRAVCTLHTQAKAILELGVMSLKNNTIKPCKRKSTSLRRSYAMHNENDPIPSNSSTDGEKDNGYRRRSRTPPSESFSYEEKHHSEHRCKSPIHRGLGNDAMSKALNQIAKSPFTRRIERVAPPRCFHQPTFTIYNGRTDPMEHVSHFN